MSLIKWLLLLLLWPSLALGQGVLPPVIPAGATILPLNNTFTGINTFISTPVLQPFPGGADLLPAVTIERNPTGSGGFVGTVQGLLVESTIPVGDAYYEYNSQFTMNNNALNSTGGLALAVAMTSIKFGTVVQVEPQWAFVAQSIDRTEYTGAAGLIGGEIDVGCQTPGQLPFNCSTDPGGNRQILKLVATGASGTHIGFGIQIGAAQAGVVIDDGICFTASCGGGLGSVNIGLDMTNQFFGTAAILMSAANQAGVDWKDTGGLYDATHGFQVGPQNDNNFYITNVSNTNITLRGVSGVMATFQPNEIITPNLPSSAGSGGLYICIDSSGNQYKKASCP